MLRQFVLREQMHLDALLVTLRGNWKVFADQGRPLAVTIAPYKVKRSLEQNALMWVWLSQIADQVWVAGRRFSAETWNEHMKRELLPDVNAKGQDKWRILPTGERALAMSTTDLNVEEMSAYMEALAATAATEYGATLQ